MASAPPPGATDLPLDLVRADGWFERVGEGIGSFRQLCEIVGERFVAFSIIAGVRIRALTVDRRSPDATLVDFTVGDSQLEQRLPLGEFRRRLASALLSDDPEPEPLPPTPDVEALQAHVGVRYVLLSPIFGYRLRALRRHPRDRAPELVLEVQGEAVVLEMEEFREILREHVRAELVRLRAPSPFAIDLARVPEAEKALREGHYDRVIELIGAWPGPLSLLLRTAEGQSLAPEARATLARSLGTLGTAYANQGRYEWAEEVLRLGIQWGQDAGAAGDLFRRLGESFVVQARHGEAIGPLMRAVNLGAHLKDVMPMLARAFIGRRRFVAALACLEQAKEAGVPDAALDQLWLDTEAGLGPAMKAFRDEVPISIETLRPPPAK